MFHIHRFVHKGRYPLSLQSRIENSEKKMSQHLSERLVSPYSSSKLINELERMPKIKLKFGFSGS